MVVSPEVSAATKNLKPLRATPLTLAGGSRYRYFFEIAKPLRATPLPLPLSLPPTQSRTADPLPSQKVFGPIIIIFSPRNLQGAKGKSPIELQRVRNGIFRVLLTIRPSRALLGFRFEIPRRPAAVPKEHLLSHR